jgi:hypothetical protein
VRLIDTLRERQRKRRERLAASQRLGHDEAAWSTVFRRDDWAPPPVGHSGRCGQCGAALDLTHSQCPQCGAEWNPNTRRGDLYRHSAVLAAATAVSALSGYGASVWLHVHFDDIRARGERVNPEMVDTLASFLWLFCSVMLMIGLTYMIEKLDLAPIGHWRGRRAPPVDASSRRKSDALS